MLALILEDGSSRKIDETRSIATLVNVLRYSDVEVVVVGEVSNGRVLWERQFSAITVMPKSFGGKEQ
jgi:hypothetical protein